MTTLQIGSFIANVKPENINYVHNSGVVVSINASYICFKSWFDGLHYSTPIDRFTLVDKYDFPL
jgi:hypothetical protein